MQFLRMPSPLSLAACATVLMTAVVGAPRRAEAAPDPTLAVLLSAASTAVPLLVTGALWLTGEGVDEGIRFDVGLTCLGLGAILGPSIGQIYGQGGTDAWVSFFLRGATGAVLLTGVGLAARGQDEGIRGAGVALAVVGGIPTTLLALYDIVDSHSSAIEAAQRKGHGRIAELETPLSIGAFSLCSAFADRPCSPPGGAAARRAP
ncbi:MAG: hypothetical protein IT384_01365 [Deltaproteobacteria bacterium]|nr:hypothetical protein [Deltaproteobacteria bacterium]